MTAACTAHGGPYAEPGINGYIDPLTWRHANPQDPNAVLNPIFRSWATGCIQYSPADTIWSGPWNDPNMALGHATGQNFYIVSLGELTREEIESGRPAGQITLVFGDPCNGGGEGVIRNGEGYDFVVFENGFISEITIALIGSIAGQMLAELGYVEVSSNGRDFARFPSVSLTSAGVGPYGTIEISNVHNLAGKHPNANGVCTGTPFDLDELAGHPSVKAGLVDLDNIRYVRIVDVPGSGDFFDEATAYINPSTWPSWQNYSENRAIYDQWPTWGSGGFDLEAIGVLNEQQYRADINLDGIVDVFDLAIFASAWQSHFGQSNWVGRCDLARPRDLLINCLDFAVFASQWRHVEHWRAEFSNMQDER
jgi:hypothetical protein